MIINAKTVLGAIALASQIKHGKAAPVNAGAADILERGNVNTCPATATLTQSNTVTITAPFTSTVKSTVRPTTTSTISIPTWVSVSRPDSTLTKTAQATVTQPVTNTVFAPTTQTATAQSTVTSALTITQTQTITNAQTATVTAFVTNPVTVTQNSIITVPGNTVTVPGNTVTIPGNTVTAAGNTVTVPGNTVTVIAQPSTTSTTTTSEQPSSTSASTSSAAPTPSEAPLNTFGGVLVPAVWASVPDGAHVTVVFTGQLGDNPCQRVAEGAAPYANGTQYVVATFPNTYFDQTPNTGIGDNFGGPFGKGDISATYYTFDAACNVDAHSNLQGQAILLDVAFQNTGIEAQLTLADLDYLPGGTNQFRFKKDATDCSLTSPPAFVSSNCDTNPIGNGYDD